MEPIDSADIDLPLYSDFIKNLMAPEQYIIIKFVEKYINNKIISDDLLLEYHKVLKNYLIIINKDDLGFYWFKGWHKYYQPNFYNRIRSGQLNFQLWLHIYLNR